MNESTEKAFRWIMGILQDNKIPFQLSGGFAARLYGSPRPLYDIDIDLPDKYFERLLPLVKAYLIYGPERYHDENFDLLLMTLKYDGQEIDISGCETDRYYNIKTKKWESFETNVYNSDFFNIFGISVPVIKKGNLVTYKKKIGRDTDLEDVNSGTYPLTYRS